METIRRCLDVTDFELRCAGTVDSQGQVCTLTATLNPRRWAGRVTRAILCATRVLRETREPNPSILLW